jgi:hypothetical protein
MPIPAFAHRHFLFFSFPSPPRSFVFFPAFKSVVVGVGDFRRAFESMSLSALGKVRGETTSGASAFTVVGFAKGAGMIEPHLATMLVYVLTDLDLPRTELDKVSVIVTKGRARPGQC